MYAIKLDTTDLQRTDKTVVKLYTFTPNTTVLLLRFIYTATKIDCVK